jgi:hypothetical protein
MGISTCAPVNGSSLNKHKFRQKEGGMCKGESPQTGPCPGDFERDFSIETFAARRA